MMRISQLSVILSLLLALRSFAESTNDPLARATAAMEAAIPRAQADPLRPIFHITSPAQWMNDPNGPIFYKGYYHLFYQLNPFGDGDGPKHWGHVRSRDLAKWEPLPIALWPSTEAGEIGVWSGCCTLNGRGEPMIFYTSVAQGKSAFDHAEQWAATSDDDLIRWKKSPANPVLSEELHLGKKVYDWRDPFIFHNGKKTFLVAGGHLEKQGHAAVNIYEAENSELTKWIYRGVLFELPDSKTPTAECPNFFKLGDQWVLFVSPYGKVRYFIGDFDSNTCRFKVRTDGTLDYGSSFYAPNTMQVPDGRRIVWGWINGFPGGRGWNGCLSLPRLLSLSQDGKLLQQPAPQLASLRGKPIKWPGFSRLEGLSFMLPLPKTNSLEIEAQFDLGKSHELKLKLETPGSGTPPIAITVENNLLKVLDSQAPLPVEKNQRLNLRIFIDHSVLEVFANDSICITKIISPFEGQSILDIDTTNVSVKPTAIHAWPMQTIW
jgi:beta-fructofuranosidase